MTKLLAKAKLSTVLLTVLAALLVLLSATQNWFLLTLSPSTGAVSHELEVAGSEAAALLVPLAVAVLALAAVLAIASRPWRYFLALLLVLLGVSLVWVSAQAAFFEAIVAVSGVVTDATGMSGAGTIAELVSGIEITFWPYVALFAAVLLVLIGVWVLCSNHLWVTKKQRSFETAAQRESRVAGNNSGARPYDANTSKESDSWDLLSGGEDPTLDR